MPEKLYLIYPLSLSGRLELCAPIDQHGESNAPKVYGGEDRIIDLDDLRQLVQICLHLENIAATPTADQQPVCTASPSSPKLSEGHPTESMGLVKRKTPTNLTPAFLGPRIAEEMTDDELVLILSSVTGRIENAISTLVSDRRSCDTNELFADLVSFHSCSPNSPTGHSVWRRSRTYSELTYQHCPSPRSNPCR